MASSDNPEVVERDVKDKEHKEDEKDEGKGGFIKKVKDFIHDIGKKIEKAIRFGMPTVDVAGITTRKKVNCNESFCCNNFHFVAINFYRNKS